MLRLLVCVDAFYQNVSEVQRRSSAPPCLCPAARSDAPFQAARSETWAGRPLRLRACQGESPMKRTLLSGVVILALAIPSFTAGSSESGPRGAAIALCEKRYHIAMRAARQLTGDQRAIRIAQARRVHSECIASVTR